MGKIINVISIASANGWYFRSLTDAKDDCDPVACFALVEFYGLNGLERTIIPIDSYTIGDDNCYLMGHDVDEFRKKIIHESEFIH